MSARKAYQNKIITLLIQQELRVAEEQQPTLKRYKSFRRYRRTAQ